MLVLRTARFFSEEDDDAALRRRYADANLKVNEILYRRLDLADAVEAHLLAAEAAPRIGFARYVVSATSPFEREHLQRLRADLPQLVRELQPEHVAEYQRRGWTMLPSIGRVDTATVVVAFAIQYLTLLVILLLTGRSAPIAVIAANSAVSLLLLTLRLCPTPSSRPWSSKGTRGATLAPSPPRLP